MKKKMLLTTLAFFIGLLACAGAYCLTKIQILYTAAITFGTTFYHFSMRLIIAYIIDTKFRNRMDYTKKWFQQKSFEPQFYRAIGVKKWKERLPSFSPDKFCLENHFVAEIISATCQAEIVHEIILICSLIPILFSAWFGAASVFVITSCMAFLFDSLFVMIQRYNRPRLLRLIARIPNKL